MIGLLKIEVRQIYKVAYIMSIEYAVRLSLEHLE